MASRTLLIGLDGATFSVLDPLMEDGVMPFLRDLTASGARATLRSTVPALTPPAWTSLLTGRGPGQHGIFDFFRKEAPQSHHIRFLTSADIGCEAIWSMINRAGQRATLLNFPLTFPAPRLDGNLVPGGWMPWRQLRLGIHPPGLYDRMKQLPGFAARELAMDMSHEEKALEGCQQDEYEGWIALHIRREQQWLAVARHLMQEDPTDFTAVLFDGVDKLQHLCWRFIDPAYADTLTEAWEQRVREQCLEYFRQVDQIMAELVQLAGPEATVVVTSDHGFGPQVRTFFVNTWLEQCGYLRWADGHGPQTSKQQVVGMGQLARHAFLLDWKHTQAYAPMPSGNGIHIVRADDEHPDGVSDELYEPLRDRMIAELRELKDPIHGQPIIANVWKREEIFDGPYIDLAPDLTLELEDGGLVSILAGDAVLKARPQPSGSHRPDGVFIARGPDLRQQAALPELSILDVAPLLLYSLHVPIPAGLEGRGYTHVVEPALLQTRPGQTEVEAAAPAASVAEVEPVWDEEGEAEVMRRLQALGYVE